MPVLGSPRLILMERCCPQTWLCGGEKAWGLCEPYNAPALLHRLSYAPALLHRLSYAPALLQRLHHREYASSAEGQATSSGAPDARPEAGQQGASSRAAKAGSSAAGQGKISDPGEEPPPLSDSEILRELGSYLLVRNSPELRWRVAASLGLLLASKGLSVAVQFPLSNPPCSRLVLAPRFGPLSSKNERVEEKQTLEDVQKIGVRTHRQSCASTCTSMHARPPQTHTCRGTHARMQMCAYCKIGGPERTVLHPFCEQKEKISLFAPLGRH